MSTHYLGSLLHLSDPTLPIGGYTHSAGLETYVQQGLVHNTATAEAFVRNMLQCNLQYNDGAFVHFAYTATQTKNLQRLVQLDEECTALKTPKEIRIASQKLGLRLMKIFSRQQPFELAAQLEQQVKSPHYCITFGLYACLLGIPEEEALLSFYYNAAVGMVTNNVKLVPLGQLDGQDILFRLQPLLQSLAQATLQADENLTGLCNTGFDIRCMQHEHLYSRLYMS
ncbi:urease accessory protein UreF [Chitinophaga horti]|uniref:Urease accessory protein UreF n=1 Tax=Chitinophaga horti TaxID=2920382 RepID=A0ABY6J0P2_9BACT|nr:urease accessory protein UreF [Chitinophaga horti]UYQ91946.1 urease accessory protein UreF [Chitinophaga horti]